MKSSRKKEGYIYVLSNQNFPFYYKVGVAQDISKRLGNYQTSSPHRNYKLEYYIKHPDCYEAEKRIHHSLEPFATDRKNEWFRCALHIIKNRVDESLEPEENLLTFIKSKI